MSKPSRDERPLAASGIIVNNIRVAFLCFAGGIALGVGSLLLLAFNGLSIGAVSGHFANTGLLGYLWTFVIGHGLLELFAIWVAGAAGFLLGKALFLPGRLAPPRCAGAGGPAGHATPGRGGGPAARGGHHRRIHLGGHLAALGPAHRERGEPALPPAVPVERHIVAAAR